MWFILCLEAFHALTLRWLHWGKLGVHYFAQGHFYMQTIETEDWTTTFLLVDKPLYPLTQSHPLKRPFILDCGVSRSLGSSSVFRGGFVWSFKPCSSFKIIFSLIIWHMPLWFKHNNSLSRKCVLRIVWVKCFHFIYEMYFTFIDSYAIILCMCIRLWKVYAFLKNQNLWKRAEIAINIGCIGWFLSCCVIACTLMLPCVATFCYRLTRQPT